VGPEGPQKYKEGRKRKEKERKKKAPLLMIRIFRFIYLAYNHDRL
jgi:hypothetical protein